MKNVFYGVMSCINSIKIHLERITRNDKKFLIVLMMMELGFLCEEKILARSYNFHTMCTSKILTDLCFTEKIIKTKNTFARVAYSVFIAKMC